MASERIRWPAAADRAREIVESYEGGVTLRQVMYRLVPEGVLPHTPSMYRHLSSHLARARREGCLDCRRVAPAFRAYPKHLDAIACGAHPGGAIPVPDTGLDACP